MVPELSVVGDAGLVARAVEDVLSRYALMLLPPAKPPALRVNESLGPNWLYGRYVMAGVIVIVV